jgi:GNAT superfamily N-acetyltransferase
VTSTAEAFVRPASPTDVDALAAVELHTALTAYAHIFPPEAPTPTRDEFTTRWEARLSRVPTGVGIFVAEVGDEVVGLVMADPTPEVDDDAHRHGHLRALYVHPDHWHQGLGRRLHDTAREYLRVARPQLRTLTLWVMENNTVARTRYESWGWHPTPTTQEIYPTIHELLYKIDQ